MYRNYSAIRVFPVWLLLYDTLTLMGPASWGYMLVSKAETEWPRHKATCKYCSLANDSKSSECLEAERPIKMRASAVLFTGRPFHIKSGLAIILMTMP